MFYAINQKEYLANFLKDTGIQLSNNSTEQSVKPLYALNITIGGTLISSLTIQNSSPTIIPAIFCLAWIIHSIAASIDESRIITEFTKLSYFHLKSEWKKDLFLGKINVEKNNAKERKSLYVNFKHYFTWKQ